MKDFAAILILSLVACVQGQAICADALAKIPDCAVGFIQRTCIRDATSAVGCDPNDLKCQCDPSKQTDISSAAIGCVLQACGVAKGLQVSSAGAEICSCAATAVATIGPLSSGSIIGTFPTPQRSSARARATSKGAMADTIFNSSPASSIALSSPPSVTPSSSPFYGASPSGPTNSATAAVGTTSSSVINSAPTSLGQSPGPSLSISSSPTSTSASASSLATMPNQSVINGPTIAVAVSISIGSVLLILAIFLIRQRRRRRRRKTGKEKSNEQNHTANEVHELNHTVNETHELCGHQEYELTADPNTLRHELPSVRINSLFF